MFNVYKKYLIMPRKQQANMIIVTTLNINHQENVQEQKHGLI